MTEKHDKNEGIWAVFSKPSMYAASIVVAVLLVVLILFGLAFFLLQRMENEKYELLAATTATNLLFIVISLYMIQAFTAVGMSLKPQNKRIVIVRDEWKEVYLEGSYVLKWTVDDALRNSSPWIFLIVAIFLPVVLSVIPDIVSIFASDTIPRIEENESLLTKEAFKTRSIMYYSCLSLIAVFITIEASVLMSLKDTAGSWIGMVLASMILDITSFLILYSMGDPLEVWKGRNFELAQPIFFFLLAYLCTISSFLTIVFARASREMIFEALVMGKTIDRTVPGEEAVPKAPGEEAVPKAPGEEAVPKKKS